MISDDDSPVRTFLIADIRGYTRYTQDHGDEAAARLATRFAGITEETVQGHAGRVVEVRGDEALAVFTSTRRALRAAIALQDRFTGRSDSGEAPLPVGIGIDVGEAVAVDTGFRGAALNVAARLSSAAGAGDILVTETVMRLAGKVEGITLSERGEFELKGVREPVKVFSAYSGEGEIVLPAAQAANLAEPGALPAPRSPSFDEVVESHVDVFQRRMQESVLRSLEGRFGALERGSAHKVPAPPEPMRAAGPQAHPNAREQVVLLSSLWGLVLLGIGTILAIGVVVWVVIHLF